MQQIEKAMQDETQELNDKVSRQQENIIKMKKDHLVSLLSIEDQMFQAKQKTLKV